MVPTFQYFLAVRFTSSLPFYATARFEKRAKSLFTLSPFIASLPVSFGSIFTINNCGPIIVHKNYDNGSLCDHNYSLSKSARIMAYFSLEATTQ